MATRINITQFANFDIHDESNLAQWRKIWKQGFESYLTASGMDNHSQMRALLLHSSEPDVQDIFMHLENVGETCKAAMDALNHLFEPKRNVVFQRHVFRQAIEGTNEPSRNFAKKLRKLTSTCEIADQNTEILNHFIDKCSPNRLRRRLLQKPNLIL